MECQTDWTLLRSFLAVAEAGSLSSAARALGLSQPTLGRHVADLEAALGIALFSRVAKGLALTEAGADLLPHARTMREAAARLALAAAGRAGAMAGPVRITAARIVAAYILPPLIARLRVDEPGIEIDLVASDRSDNLLFGEADIALRMYRPTQLDIVTRHIADLPLGFYAAPAYLTRAGRPRDMADLAGHDIVGFDRSDLGQRALEAQGVALSRKDFRVRCDDQLVAVDLVRAGCGIGVIADRVAAAHPALERLPDFFTLPSLPIWLAAPEALRQAPRLRRIFDFLAGALKSGASA